MGKVKDFKSKLNKYPKEVLIECIDKTMFIDQSMMIIDLDSVYFGKLMKESKELRIKIRSAYNKRDFETYDKLNAKYNKLHKKIDKILD